LLVYGIYLPHDINRETLMPMLNKVITAFLTGAALAATPALAQSSGTAPAQSGAPIPVQPTPAPSGTVAQMIAQSADHSTLQKLIMAAGQSGALSGTGPVTIFAPDDAAFGRLAPGTVNELLDPSHQWSAQQVVKYLIVEGSYTTQDLLTKLKTTPTLTLNTLDGQPLTLSLAGPSAIALTDAMGNKAGFISKLSDKASNGVVEYINGIPSPKMLPKPAAAPGAAPATGTPPADTNTTSPAGGTTDQDSGNGG